MFSSFLPEILTKAVLESGDSISILDSNTILKYWSAPSSSNNLNKSIGLNFKDCVHPKDKDRVHNILQSALNKKTEKIAEYRLKNSMGEYRWVDSNIVNMLHDANINGLILKTSDITEKIVLQARQKRVIRYYESLFQNYPDALFRVDAEGKIREINNGALMLFGYSKKKTIGNYFWNLVGPADREQAKEQFLKAIKGEAVSFQILLVQKDGSDYGLKITMVPVILKGRVIRVQGIVQKPSDLTSNSKNATDSSTFENLTEGFFSLNETWNYTYVNDVCADFLQRSKNELLNKNIFKCFPHLRVSIFKENCQRVFETGMSVNFYEYYAERKLTLHCTISRTETGLAIHFTDATEKLINQENISKLHMVANKITNGVMILDEHKNVQWVNASFEQITGYKSRTFLGKPLNNLLPQGSILNKRSFMKLLVMLKLSKPFSEDVHLFTGYGTEAWLTCSISPVIEEGESPDYYIVVLADVTSRKEAELDLVKHAEELFKQNRDLGQFTYIVSHNIRAPIAAALGCNNLLASVDKNDPEFDDIVKGLNHSLLKLDKVVRDMNTILSVRDRAQKDIKIPINLLEKCREVYNDIKELMTFTSADFRVEIPEDYEVCINSAYIYSIFYNLITNAIKYKSPDRKLTIKVSAHVDMNKDLILKIEDNGIGIDLEQHRNRLFKLYSRLNHELPGDGIGLFLVKTQVEALGGKIEVSSRLNEGTCFTIKLNTDS
ncbi:MAG: PAS domain S-box protein [Sphingobacteriaceae bacterium]|nr:PAS domain S-box protein [Sphingobacteriaceae bacterium]